MYEAFTLNHYASLMTCITPDTSKSIPSLTGLNVTVCPSIFSGGIGSLTVGGLFFIHEKIKTALGSSKAIISCDCRFCQSLRDFDRCSLVAIGNQKSTI